MNGYIITNYAIMINRNICIDDYWDRDSYKILEEFLPEPKKISEDFALFFIDDSVRFAIVNNANLPPLCST